MRSVLVTLTLFVAACGDLDTAAGPQDPVFVVAGRLEGDSLPAPVGEYRAAAQWLSFGSGPEIACYSGDAPNNCSGALLQTRRTQLGLSLAPTIRGFELALFELVPEDRLLIHEDARLALGSIVIYDDRDQSGGPTSGDRVAAGSAFDRQISLLVYREGDLHPFFRFFEVAFGCPPPPQGYSVMRVDQGIGCRLSTITAVIATVRSRVSTAFARCGGDAIRLVDPPDERAVFITAEENLLCLGGNRARVYLDQGDECDPYRPVRVHALVGCKPGFLFPTCWDDRAAPPQGWPCPIEGDD